MPEKDQSSIEQLLEQYIAEPTEENLSKSVDRYKTNCAGRKECFGEISKRISNNLNNNDVLSSISAFLTKIVLQSSKPSAALIEILVGINDDHGYGPSTFLEYLIANEKLSGIIKEPNDFVEVLQAIGDRPLIYGKVIVHLEDNNLFDDKFIAEAFEQLDYKKAAAICYRLNFEREDSSLIRKQFFITFIDKFKREDTSLLELSRLAEHFKQLCSDEVGTFLTGEVTLPLRNHWVIYFLANGTYGQDYIHSLTSYYCKLSVAAKKEFWNTLKKAPAELRQQWSSLPKLEQMALEHWFLPDDRNVFALFSLLEDIVATSDNPGKELCFFLEHERETGTKWLASLDLGKEKEFYDICGKSIRTAEDFVSVLSCFSSASASKKIIEKMYETNAQTFEDENVLNKLNMHQAIFLLLVLLSAGSNSDAAVNEAGVTKRLAAIIINSTVTIFDRKSFIYIHPNMDRIREIEKLDYKDKFFLLVALQELQPELFGDNEDLAKLLYSPGSWLSPWDYIEIAIITSNSSTRMPKAIELYLTKILAKSTQPAIELARLSQELKPKFHSSLIDILNGVPEERMVEGVFSVIFNLPDVSFYNVVNILQQSKFSKLLSDYSETDRARQELPPSSKKRMRFYLLTGKLVRIPVNNQMQYLCELLKVFSADQLPAILSNDAVCQMLVENITDYEQLKKVLSKLPQASHKVLCQDWLRNLPFENAQKLFGELSQKKLYGICNMLEPHQALQLIILHSFTQLEDSEFVSTVWKKESIEDILKVLIRECGEKPFYESSMSIMLNSIAMVEELQDKVKVSFEAKLSAKSNQFCRARYKSQQLRNMSLARLWMLVNQKPESVETVTGRVNVRRFFRGFLNKKGGGSCCEVSGDSSVPSSSVQAKCLVRITSL